MADRSEADDLLAAELAAGHTVKSASLGAGVSEATAFRRLQDRAFRARVQEIRTEMVSRAAGRLADSMNAAADVLVALLTSDQPVVRLRAAKALIESGLRVCELADLQRRVEDLERAAERGYGT